MARFIITGEYKDKATKAARKDLKGLSKDVSAFGKMAKKYWALATAAAGYYAQKLAKESVRAALEDEKSQRVLALTLQNVTGATNAAVIAAEAQISKMQMMYGIADDQLRPALARLARSTGNTSEALYDLQLALDISAATGKSLEAVSNALGKAQDGNAVSLQRLGLGLDANLLKSKDTKKIFKQLRETFGGFARQEAKTTEASFRRIAVAADEAKEVIGTALVDAITRMVASSGGVEGVSKTFEDLSLAVSDIITGIADTTVEMKKIDKRTGGVLGKTISWGLEHLSILGILRKQGAQTRINTSLIKAQSTQTISARNAEYVALKKNKETTDDVTNANKKTVDQIIAEEAARKAGFKITEDIDSIQTVAAAKRLEESRQYKMSVIDAAQAQYDAIKSVNDRLTAVWETQIAAFQIYRAMLASGLSVPIAMAISGYQPGGAPMGATVANVIPAPSTPANAMGLPPLERSLGGYGSVNQAPTVNVTVNAGAVGSEQYLVSLIGEAMTKYTRLGNVTAPAGFI